MSGNRTMVRRENLQNDRNSFNRIIEEWHNAVDNFSNAADQLAGSWRGDANEVFKNNVSDIKPKFATLEQSLREFSDFLAITVDKYNDNEQNVANKINSMLNR